MKNIILLLSIFLFSSCYWNEVTIPGRRTPIVHYPPENIVGTWINEGDTLRVDSLSYRLSVGDTTVITGGYHYRASDGRLYLEITYKDDGWVLYKQNNFAEYLNDDQPILIMDSTWDYFEGGQRKGFHSEKGVFRVKEEP